MLLLRSSAAAQQAASLGACILLVTCSAACGVMRVPCLAACGGSLSARVLYVCMCILVFGVFRAHHILNVRMPVVLCCSGAALQWHCQLPWMCATPTLHFGFGGQWASGGNTVLLHIVVVVWGLSACAHLGATLPAIPWRCSAGFCQSPTLQPAAALQNCGQTVAMWMRAGFLTNLLVCCVRQGLCNGG